MRMNGILQLAQELQATDIHLEELLAPTFRVNGQLRRGTQPLPAGSVESIAKELLSPSQWEHFLTTGSADVTKTIENANCRIHLMGTDRGPAIAIRVLRNTSPRLRNCNLHPSLSELIQRDHGLILLTGPTGSGKSTTLSALLEEINQTSSKHIVTLESPIEYRLRSQKSLIRQREVGRHTVSYEQGLIDCLREDPDVIVVGEMREPETMRQVLQAAETGHLVLATLHASNAADAVYRMMMSFPAESQPSVLAQLAETLVAIVSQKMTYRPKEKVLVPVLEILMGTHASKNMIRKGDITKLTSILQAGGPEGHWTFERYQSWLDSQRIWFEPETSDKNADLEPAASVFELKKARSTVEDSRHHEMSMTAAATTSPTPEPATSTLNSDNWKKDFLKNQRDGKEVFPTPAPTANRKIMTAAERAKMAQAEQASATASTSRPSRTSNTRVHKDGRIEIPELEIDLDEIAKTIVVKKEDE